MAITAEKLIPGAGYFLQEPEWLDTFKYLDDARDRKIKNRQLEFAEEVQDAWSRDDLGNEPTFEDAMRKSMRTAGKYGQFGTLTDLIEKDPSSAVNLAKAADAKRKSQIDVLDAANDNPELAREMAKAYGMSEETAEAIDKIYKRKQADKRKDGDGSKAFKIFHNPVTGDHKTVGSREEAQLYLDQGYLPGKAKPKSAKDEILEKLKPRAKGSDMESLEKDKTATNAEKLSIGTVLTRKPQLHEIPQGAKVVTNGKEFKIVSR